MVILNTARTHIAPSEASDGLRAMMGFEHRRAREYADGLGSSNMTMFLKAELVTFLANETLVNLVRGGPVLIEKTGGRFAGRGWADHRRLDVEIIARAMSCYASSGRGSFP
jgi:hypothetical protein